MFLIYLLYFQQDELYSTAIKPTSREKHDYDHSMSTTVDEHRYEYIDNRRFPVMRFALLANENDTVIHSYPSVQSIDKR